MKDDMDEDGMNETVEEDELLFWIKKRIWFRFKDGCN